MNNWHTSYIIETDDVDKAIDIKNKILANSVSEEMEVSIKITIEAHGEATSSTDE